MRRSVSGEMPTTKATCFSEAGSKDVMVRQVPLMLILSPSLASSRISAQSEMVREVPPPPAEVSSWGWRAETTELLLGY